MVTPLTELEADPAIRGFLHLPDEPCGSTVVLTHGAGSNCQAKLLVEMSSALAASGFTVLRFDLPFRFARPQGPPRPGSAARDREGLRRAVSIMRGKTGGRLFLGGHSYGGRQSTMVAAEEPGLVEGLLLFSYPLPPPRKPAELRTSHFPKLRTPTFFVHGTRDAFGSIGEMQSALRLIPAEHVIFEVEGAGHDLFVKKAAGDLRDRIVREFQTFLGKTAGHRSAGGNA